MSAADDDSPKESNRGKASRSDARDPLGKRALYWAPAQRDEGYRTGRRDFPVGGKRALFSAAETPAPKRRRSARGNVPPAVLPASARGSAGQAGSRRRLSGEPAPVRPARGTSPSSNSSAEVLGAVVREIEQEAGIRGRTVGDLEVTRASRAGRRRLTDVVVNGPLGPITLHCSTCGVHSEVDMVEYLLLHLPIWLWRPGKGFTRFMTCPACRRRTWVSASWAPWSR
jgi:hypothetical protein